MTWRRFAAFAMPGETRYVVRNIVLFMQHPTTFNVWRLAIMRPGRIVGELSTALCIETTSLTTSRMLSDLSWTRCHKIARVADLFQLSIS